MIYRFYRKSIMYKYTHQVTLIGKQPLFIIAQDVPLAYKLMERLNKYERFHLQLKETPFFHEMGALAYAQYVGGEASLYQQSSRLKGDKLEETLRKVSFKNMMGNNYGFDISLTNKTQGKRFYKNMQDFHWGAMIQPTQEQYQGLAYLFSNMKVLYLSLEPNITFDFLLKDDRCLYLKTDELTLDQMEAKILAFV